jgi:D-glycerate 3-kinase
MGRVAPTAKPGQRGGMDALPLLLDWLKPRLGQGPLIVGLAGAQGSGKSTLAAGLAQRLPGCAGALPDAGGSVVAVSLDDFYLWKAGASAPARSPPPCSPNQ